MIIYPDIEIQDGHSVSLPRGRKEEATVFEISPLEAAEQFQIAGAEWLQVVDIDGVFQGGRFNSGIICEIIDNAKIPVQVAGGIRTEQQVDWWFEHGATRIVLGTAAIKDAQLLRHVCHQYPDRIVVSIDVRGGYVLIDGWQTRTSFHPITLGKNFRDIGVAAVVYTDIDRFENHSESSLAGTSEMGTEIDLPIISSGTVRTLDDISLLSLLPNIHGVITGRALFSGAVDLKEAIAIAREPGVDRSLAKEGVRPQPASSISAGRTLPTDYTTMGQELLDLHRAHTEGAMSNEEYQIARQSILTRFHE